MAGDLLSCAMQFKHFRWLCGWGKRPRPSNDEFVFRVRDCQDLYACMSFRAVFSTVYSR